MCNFCNSGTSGCGSCCNTTTARTVNTCNYGAQRLCRDACGNVRVTQCNLCCGCNSCNGCNSGCNCGGQCCGNNSGSANNGNGGYACITICGNTTATGNSARTSVGTDWYYARQYGLLPYGSCPCSAGYNYNTTTQTT